MTNTTKESKNLLYSRLTDIGFQVQKEEIYTSLLAARKKIEELSKSRSLNVLNNPWCSNVTF